MYFADQSYFVYKPSNYATWIWTDISLSSLLFSEYQIDSCLQGISRIFIFFINSKTSIVGNSLSSWNSTVLHNAIRRLFYLQSFRIQTLRVHEISFFFLLNVSIWLLQIFSERDIFRILQKIHKVELFLITFCKLVTMIYSARVSSTSIK